METGSCRCRVLSVRGPAGWGSPQTAHSRGSRVVLALGWEPSWARASPVGPPTLDRLTAWALVPERGSRRTRRAALPEGPQPQARTARGFANRREVAGWSLCHLLLVGQLQRPLHGQGQGGTSSLRDGRRVRLTLQGGQVGREAGLGAVLENAICHRGCEGVDREVIKHLSRSGFQNTCFPS